MKVIETEEYKNINLKFEVRTELDGRRKRPTFK